MSADGRAAQFVDDSGASVVSYRGLRAWDADEQELVARMDAADGALIVTVHVRDARYPITIDPIAQQALIKASNAEQADGFGSSIALSGDTLAVGAPYEDGAGIGVNPVEQNDNSVTNAGAVYVFKRKGATWVQQAYLKGNNQSANDRFGWSVALSGDTLAVGMPGDSLLAPGPRPGIPSPGPLTDTEAVWVFHRSGETWRLQAYLEASNPGANDEFGETVALSGDTLAVGAFAEDSNGTGVNPNTQADNSVLGSGAAYVFRRIGANWSHEAYIKASNAGWGDGFGSAVALSGDTLAVGAPAESGGGSGVNPDTQADDSLASSGAVYLFRRAGGVWVQEAYVKASNPGRSDAFGVSLALSSDTLAVAAPFEDSNGAGVNPIAQTNDSMQNSGAVYVFERTGGTWTQQAYLKASNPWVQDGFGDSVAIFGDTVAVGVPGETSGATGVHPDGQADYLASGSGAAYVFHKSRGVWARQAYVKASNTAAFARFGFSLAFGGGLLAVGAPGEDSQGTGVDPPVLVAGGAHDSGAVYTFGGLPPGPAANVGVYESGRWRLRDRNGSGAADLGSDFDFDFGFPGAIPVAGDWNGDGRKEAGLFIDGFWYLDSNGDGFWDGGSLDKQFHFGWAGATPIAGDWDGDGRDSIGIFANGFWFLDDDGNGSWDGPEIDTQAELGWNGVTPMTGDWDGSGRDRIGIFIDGFWYLDYNGDGEWSGHGTDRQAELGWRGVTPLVGDWDGDGNDSIGVYTDGFWFLDYNGDGAWGGTGVDVLAHFGFAGSTPVQGDWNGDGRVKMGIFIDGFWYLDYDASGTWDGTSVDRAFQFGQAGDKPMVGPW